MRPADSALSATPRLVLRFALYTGVACLLGAGLALWFANSNATSRAEAAVWQDAKFVADALGRDDLARTATHEDLSADEVALLDDLFGREALRRDVLRVSVFGADGRVTYSTDHSLIGTRDDADARSVAAAHLGKAVYGVRSDHGQPAAAEKVLASYVPVRWALDPTAQAGVLAIYRDYAPVAKQIREDFLLQAAAIAIALLILYGASFPILRRVTATLAARNRRLAESEARYRALTEQASDGIFVCDRDGRIVDVNPRMADLFGHTREELLELSLADLIEPDDLDAVPLRLHEVLGGRQVLQERRLHRKDGSRFVGELHGALLEDGRIYASLRDVTARKLFEEELRHEHQNEAVGRLATGVANDFNKLLDAIEEHSENVLTRLSDDNPLRDQVYEIKDATVWGSSLVSQLLAFGQRQELRPAVVDLGEVVAGMRELLRMLVGDRVALELKAEPGLAKVVVDPDQLEKILVDLVIRAREAMPLGGTVTIETANKEFAARGGARAPRFDSGRFVMLAISDTGGERRNKSTRPFETASGEDELMGLGLAAVYAVVQQSGGSIGIESEPASGTTVRVYLPSVETAAAANPVAAAGAA